MILVVLLSSVLGYEMKLQTNSITGGLTGTLTQTNYYELNGDFHFVVNVMDQYGNPVINTQVNITVGGANGTGFSMISQTNQNGIADFSLGNLGNVTSETIQNYSSVMVYGTYKVPNKWIQTVGMRWAPIVPHDVVVNGTNPYNSRYSLTILRDPNHNFMFWLHIFYVGPQGQLAPPTKIYYERASSSNSNYFSGLSETAMNYSHTVSDFETLNTVSGISSNLTQIPYLIALFSSNGTLLGRVSGVILAQPTPSQVDFLFFNYAAIPLGIFLPIMGIIVGYSGYGRDRSSGFLESTESRPVTKASLASARISSISVAIVLATLLSLGILVLFTKTYYLIYPPRELILFSIFSLTVSTISFAFLVLLISHLTSSSSRLIASSILLFVFFYWLYYAIIEALVTSVFNFSYVSSQFAKSFIISSYFSPLGTGNLIQLYLTGYWQFLSGNQNTLASYGLSIEGIIISGFAWVFVPMVLVLLLSKKRD